MAFDYARYVVDFNTNEDANLVSRYFCEDAVWYSVGGERHGHDAIKSALALLHDGVQERMRPQVILQSETNVMAEVDMDFRATADRPDFPLGPMHAGDVITVKVLASYALRGDRISRLITMARRDGIVSAVPPFE